MNLKKEKINAASGKSGLHFVIPELLEQGGSNIRNLKINKVNGEKIPCLVGRRACLSTRQE
jgi:hypothetical protein